MTPNKMFLLAEKIKISEGLKTICITKSLMAMQPQLQSCSTGSGAARGPRCVGVAAPPGAAARAVVSHDLIEPHRR